MGSASALGSFPAVARTVDARGDRSLPTDDFDLELCKLARRPIQTLRWSLHSVMLQQMRVHPSIPLAWVHMGSMLPRGKGQLELARRNTWVWARISMPRASSARKRIDAITFRARVISRKELLPACWALRADHGSRSPCVPCRGPWTVGLFGEISSAPGDADDMMGECPQRCSGGVKGQDQGWIACPLWM